MGKSDNQFAAQGEKHIAEISVKLIDKSERSISTEKFSQMIKKELQERTAGAKVEINQVDIMGSTSEAPIQLVLNGSNVDHLLSYADTYTGKNENCAWYFPVRKFLLRIITGSKCKS
jgi:HAE1 family hydrophobic/amphiphilic exporter-1